MGLYWPSSEISLARLPIKTEVGFSIVQSLDFNFLPFYSRDPLFWEWEEVSR